MATLCAAVPIIFVRYEFHWPLLIGIILAPFGAVVGVLLMRARTLI